MKAKSKTKAPDAQKSGSKAEPRRLGNLPPLYRFYLNPYIDMRFSNCPECEQKMGQRKLPLFIHLSFGGQDFQPVALNKTCKYCRNCDLLIAHKDVLENLLNKLVAAMRPERAGKPLTSDEYLVIGTMEKPTWKQGIERPLTVQEMRDNLHDFKEHVSFKIIGGWGKWDDEEWVRERLKQDW